MSDQAKLEKLELAIHGQPGQPGALERLDRHQADLYGDGNKLGLMQKVGVMWKVYWWIACAISAGVGALANEMIHRFIHP